MFADLTMRVYEKSYNYLNCRKRYEDMTGHHSYIKKKLKQLSVGLIAQLVENCTGIAEVMGSNPVQAWIYFCEPLISQLRNRQH